FQEWTVTGSAASASQDFTVGVPASAGVGGVVTLQAVAIDDHQPGQPTTATDTSVSVARDSVLPVISNVLPANGTTVVPGSSVQLSADITDDIAVRSVALNPSATVTNITGNHYVFTFKAPTTGSSFNATLTATDFGGNVATATVSFLLSSDQPPTGTLSVSPTTPVLPLSPFKATASASDDHALPQGVFLASVGV